MPRSTLYNNIPLALSLAWEVKEPLDDVEDERDCYGITEVPRFPETIPSEDIVSMVIEEK